MLCNARAKRCQGAGCGPAVGGISAALRDAVPPGSPLRCENLTRPAATLSDFGEGTGGGGRWVVAVPGLREVTIWVAQALLPAACGHLGPNLQHPTSNLQLPTPAGGDRIGAGARSSAAEHPAHNRWRAGSNPAGPTTLAPLLGPPIWPSMGARTLRGGPALRSESPAYGLRQPPTRFGGVWVLAPLCPSKGIRRDFWSTSLPITEEAAGERASCVLSAVFGSSRMRRRR